MHYSEFLPEDFAADESFQNWYFQRNPRDVEFWDQWIKQHPQGERHIREARAILDRLRESISQQSNYGQLHHSWNTLKAIIDAHDRQAIPLKSSKKFSYITWAAALALIAVAAAFWTFQYSLPVVHRTEFGETRSITLPDNSVVTLNGNSKLTYDKSFGQEHGDREVRLAGEGYFSVVHTEFQQKFLVHTSDQVVVEVLGTEFNVKSRQSGIKVVLNSGKIVLNLKHQTAKITMEPGELVSIEENSSGYQKTLVNTDLYTSWKCKLLVFDNTPLQEITNILQENYGLQVKVADASLLELKVSGSVPSDNIKLLMEGLSESFGLTIQHTENQVNITKKVN